MAVAVPRPMVVESSRMPARPTTMSPLAMSSVDDAVAVPPPVPHVKPPVA